MLGTIARAVIATFVACALLISAIPSRTISIRLTPNETSVPSGPLRNVLSPLVQIALASEKYGVSEQDLLDIAKCESNMKHEGVYGDGTLAYGIFQFHRGTFNMFKVEAGKPDMEYENMGDQIELTAWALKKGYGYHWSCYKPKPA